MLGTITGDKKYFFDFKNVPLPSNQPSQGSTFQSRFSKVLLFQTRNQLTSRFFPAGVPVIPSSALENGDQKLLVILQVERGVLIINIAD